MERIMLLVGQQQNRRLLAELLAGQYEVVAEPEESLAEPFDLCIIDGPSLERIGDRLEARKRAEQPTFLPFLFITSRRDVGMATQHLWRRIDELLVTPVQRAELLARVAALLERRRMSREYTRIMVQGSPLAIVLIDQAGKIRHWNPAAERIFGWQQQEVLGQPFPIYATDEGESAEWGSVRELLEQALQGNELRNHETRYRRKDGTPIYIIVSVTPLRDAGAQVTGAIVVIDDITDRKKAELALARERAELRATLYSIGDAVISTDRSGRVARMNPVAEQLTGWPESEAVGLPLEQIFRIVNEETRAEVENPVKRVLRDGMIVGLANHTLLISRDGREIPIADAGAPIMDEDGNITGVVLVFRDQTEQRRAQRAVQEARQFAESIVDTVREPLVVLDDQMRVVSANRAFYRTFRVTPEETQGRLLYELGNRQWDIPALKELLESILPQNTSFEDFEVTHDFPHLGRRTMLLNARRLYREGERPHLILLAIQDVTERRQAEQERAELQKRLFQAQKLESIGRLAGGIAHDFNNMLTVIMCHTELALMKTDTAHPTRSDLEEVRKAAQRAANLTRQLLALARRQAVTPRVIDLNDSVGNMIGMLERLVGEQVKIVWQPADALWPIKIDPSQIDQVITNLAVNARDAMPSGGQLTISTTNVVLDEQFCRQHREAVPGRYVMISVKDTGCGMDQETLEQIFEPFFTTKTDRTATGLGLATVYAIVKQNDGFILVESEPGRGSTFKIYFPAVAEPVQKEELAQEGELARGRGELILVVEDEPQILNMAKATLELLGYSVLAADSPRKAIELAEQHRDKLQLLLTDVVMPEMNGLELAKRVRTIVPGIKCLFVSGYAADIMADPLAAQQPIELVSKPLSLNELAAKVKAALSGQ